jgi:hypothetical protein
MSTLRTLVQKLERALSSSLSIVKIEHKLTPERIQRLESLGFVWDPLEALWGESFAALLAFKERFGHCNVPQSWKENPKLGKWCAKQRQTKKQGKLTPERIQRLDSLGFEWTPRKAQSA